MCKTHIQPANLQKLFGLTIKSTGKCTFLEVLSNNKERFLKTKSRLSLLESPLSASLANPNLDLP